MPTDIHGAAGSSGGKLDALHLEGGAVDDGVAEHERGRQNTQNDDNGDDRTAAQTGAKNGDNGVGGNVADQQSGGRQDGAGGEDGGEGGVQRFHDGFLMGHRGLQLLVVAGNDDGVVNVRAHLNGLHDEVAKEIQRLIGQSGEGEVNPDTSQNTGDEQNRQSR